MAGALDDVTWPDGPRWAHGRRRAHDDRPVQLVVVGDSFSFTDDRGPQLPSTPTLWPNLAAATVSSALGVEVHVTVLARPAMTVREALEMVRKDPHAQHDVLAKADAVVLAIGSYDHSPMGVPTPVRELASYLRPYGLRRKVRLWLHRVYPWLVRLTRGRFTRTSTTEFVRDHDRVLEQLRGICHGAAGVAVGPSSHDSAYYGGRAPRFRGREQLQLQRAAAQGFTPIEAWRHVTPHLDELNVDRIHWSRATHAKVAADVAEALLAQLRGEADRPPRPGRDE